VLGGPLGYPVTAFALRTTLAAVAIIAGLIVFIELGRWFGARRRALPGIREELESSAIDAAVFALFGLLIAFSFSGALDRFDNRRTLIVAEATAIETAYLRLDLLPASAQPELRALFREYTESRLAYYRKITEVPEAKAERYRARAIQEVIWSHGVEAARATGDTAVIMLVTSALNGVFDAEVERIAALNRHPPLVIFGMLFAVGFASAFLAGYSTAGGPRNWARVVVFSASLAVAVFVILNLEYPRYGLIHLELADQPLHDVLERMQ
jgi:hypothetical protein